MKTCRGWNYVGEDIEEGKELLQANNRTDEKKEKVNEKYFWNTKQNTCEHNAH